MGVGVEQINSNDKQNYNKNTITIKNIIAKEDFQKQHLINLEQTDNKVMTFFSIRNPKNKLTLK